MPFQILLSVYTALFLACCSQTVAANSLPETSILISTTGGEMMLTIEVPAPDLNLAMGTGLGDASPIGPLSPQSTAQIAEYFGAHLAISIADVGPLDMRLRSAAIQQKQGAGAEHFDIALLQFAAPLPMDIGIFPMTLTYDAVMHHARNHRAHVFWQRWEGDAPMPMGQILFDQKLGKTAALILIPAP